MRVYLASLGFVFVGCATQSAPDTSDQLDSPAAKADGSDPAGAYSNGSAKIGQLASLSLDDDYTFTRTELGACPGGGTCDPTVETGTYLFTHNNEGTHYIRFYADDGSDLDRYRWKLGTNDHLELELDSESDAWFAMTAGGSCEAAGGSCVALSPGSCSGTVGDATQDSCGGGLGVECCLPATAEAQSCDVDSDCSGALPRYCRSCSDGTEDCAHWSCAANSCAIVTCE
ncbi:MAG TPA: hypothetical protein VGF94_19495 [Kofleriaceae bacterium]|jgi:hypothetical protein